MDGEEPIGRYELDAAGGSETRSGRGLAWAGGSGIWEVPGTWGGGVAAVSGISFSRSKRRAWTCPMNCRSREERGGFGCMKELGEDVVVCLLCVTFTLLCEG